MGGSNGPQRDASAQLKLYTQLIDFDCEAFGDLSKDK